MKKIHWTFLRWDGTFVSSFQSRENGSELSRSSKEPLSSGSQGGPLFLFRFVWEEVAALLPSGSNPPSPLQAFSSRNFLRESSPDAISRSLETKSEVRIPSLLRLESLISARRALISAKEGNSDPFFAVKATKELINMNPLRLATDSDDRALSCNRVYKNSLKRAGSLSSSSRNRTYRSRIVLRSFVFPLIISSVDSFLISSQNMEIIVPKSPIMKIEQEV